jgi:hypothetical protein
MYTMTFKSILKITPKTSQFSQISSLKPTEKLSK